MTLRSFVRENASLLASGLAIEAVLIFLVGLGDLRRQIPLFWAGIFTAFAFYLVAVARLGRQPQGSARFVLLAALVFRLTMWWSPPTLSDDIYRYIWDGRVQLAGINPYQYAPAAPEVAHLRDALHAKINHPEIPTVYPPLSQLFFRLVGAVQPGVGAVKLALILVECGLLLLLVRILEQRRMDRRRVLFYAWNPLPLVEVAGSGHVDALGVFLLFLGLYWLAAERRVAASWALAGAFLSKLVPLLVLPVFWRQMGRGVDGGWRRWFGPSGRWALLWFAALGAAGFLLFAGAGSQLFAGLQTYVLKWRFNDVIFSLVYEQLKRPNWEWDDRALMQGKQILAAVLALVVLWATLRRADAYGAVFVIMGAYMLLTPTLHPWYLLWILPFLPLFPHPAWIALSGGIFLAYQVLIGYSKYGTWEEAAWVRWAEFVPFYFFLVVQAYRRLR